MTLSLGPFVVPLMPVVLLVSVLLAAWFASWLTTRLTARQAGAPDASLAEAATDAVFHAVFAGLLAARLGHVLGHASAYLASPWDIVDVRDGGWAVSVGVAAAGLWLGVRAWRVAPLRRPLAGAAALGGAVALGLGALGSPASRDAWPDMALAPLTGGTPQTLTELAQGKPVVINLWASWCGPCRAEMADFAAAQAQHPEVVFVFVNQGESAEQIGAFLREQALDVHHVMMDPTRAFGRLLGARGLPTTAFYNAAGERTAQHMGALNGAALTARIATLVAGAGDD